MKQDNIQNLEDLLSVDSQSNVIVGLTDELKGIYLKKLLSKENKSILFVTNSLYEANKFYQIMQDLTDQVYLFPMDDFLTSEALAISPELKTTRLETLKAMTTIDQPKIVITNLMGLLRYLPTVDTYRKSFLTLSKDMEYDPKKLVEELYRLGYQREVLVGKTGEMAVRGYVVDIFPVGTEFPIRLEFWGDTIESIRTFDIDTQLTNKEISTITIEPNSEFLLSKVCEVENHSQRMLKKYGPVTFIGEYLQDYIQVFLNYNDIKIGYERLLDEMFHYHQSSGENENMDYMNELENCYHEPRFALMNFDDNVEFVKNTQTYHSTDISNISGPIDTIKKKLVDYHKSRKFVILALSNRKQANQLLEQFDSEQFIFTDSSHLDPMKINVIVYPLQYGFTIDHYMIFTPRELFENQSHQHRYKTNFKLGTKINNIDKLSPGDYIVHQIHGIGRYCGMKTLTKSGLKKDYLMLEYKNGDKVYIPVEKIDYISKYSAKEGVQPKLNKLGGTDWEKTKLRVKKKIESIAGDLLKLYAAREASPGIAFDEDNSLQYEFEKEFAYQETKDQLKVTEEIKKDMEAPHPMDRLLCGDVGFGKTEVAFRAMFKAVMSGYQVAFLCPTTILSTQHYKNALERFTNYPIKIKILNRFTSTKETKQVLKDLKEGNVDIIIGTHRILSSDIVFKNLGLLVVDEEQRFGVKHKEKIKQWKETIDVLTLSATPIPRTLQMSMSGLRSLSLIETPPVNRYPVQTYVVAENDALLKDAIYKELSRNGQVFILSNRIEEMEKMKYHIERLVPDAKVITAHGQMAKRELEDVMIKFTNHEYDVMICTTIIETGIDIPSVNTLIIRDADRFGLAQLYQIRGRVGRSDRIAYCYLMYQPGKILSEIATKRLKVIKDFTELGSGFRIAMRDLSIRGAGDILGQEQAGFVDSVGIELFLKMLNEEMKKLKGLPVAEEVEKDSTPLLEVETSIKDSYVEEEELKIEIHKKINEIDSYEKLHQVKEEIEDRFGTIDESLLIYMYEEWFEKMAAALNIKRIRQTKNSIEMILEPELTAKVNGELLFIEASRISRMFRFQLRGRCLVIILDTVKLEKHFIYYLIEFLEVLKKATDNEK